MKHVVLGLMTATAAAAYAGQVPYAKVVAVDGKVTVSSKDQMLAATVGMPLVQGASILPGSKARATVQFANGCQVSVKGGQMLTVDEAACSMINAKAHTVKGSAQGVATGGEEVTGVGIAGYTALGIVTLVALDEASGSPSPAPAVSGS